MKKTLFILILAGLSALGYSQLNGGFVQVGGGGAGGASGPVIWSSVTNKPIYNTADSANLTTLPSYKWYSQGTPGDLRYEHQGTYWFRNGINILPNTTYGCSNLNLYYTTTPKRGMGVLNFVGLSPDGKYKGQFTMGVDVAQKLTGADSIAPMFIFGASYGDGMTVNDLMGYVGHPYTTAGGSKRYMGQINFNAMGLSDASVVMASQNSHPSSLKLLRIHRSQNDSTNAWLTMTHGPSGLTTFDWADTVSGTAGNTLTWYSRKTGGFSYLTGSGFKFQFTSNNNKLEMQGGELKFNGGTFLTNPNRTDWNSASQSITSNSTNTSSLGNSSGLLVRNANNTTGSIFSIYNQNSASAYNSSLNFVNVDQTLSGAVTINTRDGSTRGERVRINETGQLILKELESDILASQLTAGDAAVYVKDGKLKIATLVSSAVVIKAMPLDASTTTFAVDSLYGTELLTNKSFETFTGTPDNGVDDSYSGFNVSSTGVSEATTGKFGYAVKLNNTLGDSYVNNLASQIASVTAGVYYRLTYWTKGDGTNAGAVRIRDNVSTLNILANSAGNTGVTAATWTKKVYDFVAPASCTGVTIYFYGAGANGSNVYFDSVSLKAKTP